MIPFKAKAWLDLTERRNRWERIDRNDINKHKRDIYRLSDLVSSGFKFELPQLIANDMRMYITAVQGLLGNTPRKERESEKIRIKKIITFFALGDC